MVQNGEKRIELPHIAIIGSGALACLFGARLSTVSRVTLIGSWADQIAALKRNGITLKEIGGELSRFSVAARRFPAADGNSPFEPADFGLVLVKSFQTAVAGERLRHCIKRNGVILSLQNGIGNQETLLDALPFHMISSGSTMQGGYLEPDQLATVTHAGNGLTVIDDKPFLKPLRGLLSEAGFPVETPEGVDAASIEAVLWGKLIVNAAINPLTALLGVPNGFLATNEDAKRLAIDTAQEAAAVAQIECGWAIPDDVGQMGIEVALQTAANRSSMLQDVSRGSRTEIEAICGEIVRRGEQHGVDVALNRLWLQLIRKAEADGGSGGRPLYTAEQLLTFTE